MVARVKCGSPIAPKRMVHPPKKQRRRSGVVALWSAYAYAFVGVTVAALACSATNAEPTQERAQQIAGGTADVSHQSVFLLARESKDSSALCTATLIAPNLLLTARHCVSPGTGDDHVLCGDSVLGEPFPASAFFTTNDPMPRDHSAFFSAVDVRVPGQGVDTCGYDVALIILQQNVPATISVPAVPRIDREVQPGEKYTAVGYGLNEAGHQTGSRMVLGDLSIECQPGSCGEGVESTEFRGETGICSGDSGGPALDADGKVVGVVSRGGPDCSTPVYSTVTAWHDFIIDTAKDAAKLGGYAAPFWVTTGLSDPPVLVQPDGAAGAGGGSDGEPVGASQGEPCGENACQSDLVCYAPEGETGTCTVTCNTIAECHEGQICQSSGSVSVCTLPHGGGDDHGGCSVAAPTSPSPRPVADWLLAGLALGAVVARSRRRRH
jgi:MYXO-CTERM domain-containing protein